MSDTNLKGKSRPYIDDIDVDVNPGDIQIGAVEIKDGTSDTRAVVDSIGLNVSNKYNLANFDKSSDPIYIGKIDKDGNWLIKKITVATGEVLYAVGSANYATAWSDRTLQSYDTFDNKF